MVSCWSTVLVGLVTFVSVGAEENRIHKGICIGRLEFPQTKMRCSWRVAMDLAKTLIDIALGIFNRPLQFDWMELIVFIIPLSRGILMFDFRVFNIFPELLVELLYLAIRSERKMIPCSCIVWEKGNPRSYILDINILAFSTTCFHKPASS